MAGTFKLLQNLAGIIGGALVLAFAIDWLAKTFGYHTTLFCWALIPMMQVAYILGYCLTIVGIMLWIFTFFRNEKPLGLALGGVMLVFLPPLLPHYLGVSCGGDPVVPSPGDKIEKKVSHPGGPMAYPKASGGTP